MSEKIFDCIILGAGPAGLSAALYAKRANLKIALMDSSAIGGAPANYCEIENYLGFGKIKGFELCEKFESHIDEFEIDKFPYEEIKNVDLTSPIKKVETLNGIYCAKSIIIATGAKPLELNVKGEKENIGHGVSYCAVCDGAFYKDKITAVVGGGNSALEEAIYLTKFSKKVYIIHRRSEFRADEIIQKRARENNKIEFIVDSTVEEIVAKKNVEAVIVKNTKNAKTKKINIDGIFPYIGIKPNAELFCAQIKQDEAGFIITDEYMKTSLDGVYAIGDVRKTPLRQVITAVSDGAVAAVSLSKYLISKNKEIKAAK